MRGFADPEVGARARARSHATRVAHLTDQALKLGPIIEERRARGDSFWKIAKTFTLWSTCARLIKDPDDLAKLRHFVAPAGKPGWHRRQVQRVYQRYLDLK